MKPDNRGTADNTAYRATDTWREVSHMLMADDRTTLMNDCPHPMMLFDRDEHLVAANRHALELIAPGSLEPVLGLSLRELVNSRYVLEALRTTVEEGHAGATERQRLFTALTTLDGSRISVECSGSLTSVGGHDLLMLIASDVGTNCDDHARLQQSEEYLRRAIEHAPFGLYLYEASESGELILTEANAAAERILGVSNVSLLNKSLEEAFPDLVDTDIPSIYRRVVADGGMWHSSSVAYDDGKITGAYEVTALRAGPGQLAVFFTDVTENRRTGAEEQQYREKLGTLTASMTLVEDRERKRLADDLHDRVLQPLAVARMHLDAARSKGCWDSEHLPKMAEMISNATQEARALTMELSPSFLYELGLERALLWLCEEVERGHGLRTSEEIQCACDDLDEETQAMLFRSARELLMNVVQHAKSTTARVALREDEGYVVLEVADAGKGFDVRNAEMGGFGLMSIRERAQHLGGSIEIESAESKGAVVRVRVPLLHDPLQPHV